VGMNNKFINVLVLIVQGLVSLAFLGAGCMKLLTPYDALAIAPNMGWVMDFSPTSVLVIASSEVLLAVGMLLSFFIEPLKKWTSIFALGLIAIMLGAAATHIGRGEPIAPNIVLASFAAIVAISRRDRLKSH
jgi:hypothetical protein